MNPIFAITFLIVWIYFMAIDRRKLAKRSASVKLLYGLFAFCSIGLFAIDLLGFTLPMPSRMFIDLVSPRVMSFVNQLGAPK